MRTDSLVATLRDQNSGGPINESETAFHETNGNETQRRSNIANKLKKSSVFSLMVCPLHGLVKVGVNTPTNEKFIVIEPPTSLVPHREIFRHDGPDDGLHDEQL